MNARLEDDNYRIGFQLGKLYAEVQAYATHTADAEDEPLARTLLATLEALGDIPEAHPAVVAAMDAWDKGMPTT